MVKTASKNHLIAGVFICIFISAGMLHAADIPAALETITADDGSKWERVSTPGFGNSNNMGVVALCPYQGSLYAITRNDITGFELWKTAGTGWVRVTVPGFTDNNNYYGYIESPTAPNPRTKYNLMQNIWGDMIEFNSKLYVIACSGYQGNRLYGSLGLQIWRFDGTVWQPVVSHSVDADESGGGRCYNQRPGFQHFLKRLGHVVILPAFAGGHVFARASADC